MDASAVSRAVAAATSIVGGLGLRADDARILQNSNKLALRLLPCDVFARVAIAGQEVATFEVELAQRLAELGSPLAALDPRLEPIVHERDGFVVTLWTYYEPVAAPAVSPADYANALARLHAGMAGIAVAAPHFTDRVAEAQQLVASHEHAPGLAEVDRILLKSTLDRLRQAICNRRRDEQLIHGEPYPGNVLNTRGGLLFIDLETCCRGPIEFDLAHAPDEVSEHYPTVDDETLRDCRGLVLAMVAAWRFDGADQFPSGIEAGGKLLSALRDGPPWATLDVVMSD